MEKLRKSKKAFTLIEIMVVIAIISILAAVILVSMSSYGKKARSTKMLTQVSSAIPGMMSCLGNGGYINIPTPNAHLTTSLQLCTLSANYGYWPTTTGDLASYFYGSITSSVNFSSSNWFIRMNSPKTGGDDIGICCNSAQNGCEIAGADGSQTTCTATVTP